MPGTLLRVEPSDVLLTLAQYGSELANCWQIKMATKLAVIPLGPDPEQHAFQS